MIGVICAMPEEIIKINESLTETTEIKVNNFVFHKGKLNGVEIVTNICGIGKVFSAISTQIMILQFSPSLIINLGAAGSLDENIHIANIVIGEKVCQHDMDCSPIGFAKGEIINLKKVWFDCDKDAISIFEQTAKKLNLTYFLGNIATGDAFVHTQAEKKLITSKFDAQAAEMEGASIGLVCYIYNIPFIVIRAISDNADKNASQDFLSYVDKVTADAVNLLINALPQL